MPFCKNCNIYLEENTKFCPSCGTPVETQTNENKNTTANTNSTNMNVSNQTFGREEVVVEKVDIPVIKEEMNVREVTKEQLEIEAQNRYVAPEPKKASGNLNVAQLVWAIINLILCCTPLGIASLIFTIIAKDAPTATEEEKKLKTAKTCNLIGTIGGAIGIILYIVLIVVMTIIAETSGGTMYM